MAHELSGRLGRPILEAEGSQESVVTDLTSSDNSGSQEDSNFTPANNGGGQDGTSGLVNSKVKDHYIQRKQTALVTLENLQNIISEPENVDGTTLALARKTINMAKAEVKKCNVMLTTLGVNDESNKEDKNDSDDSGEDQLTHNCFSLHNICKLRR
jgi:hypothetical protein